MSQKSANEKKAQDGETAVSGQNPVPQTPLFNSGGSTVLGMDSGMEKLERVPDTPTLTRYMVKKDGKKESRDFWGAVIKGLDGHRLEKILAIAKTDDAYDMTQFIRDIEYQGFDRLFYIKHALGLMSVSVFSRFAIIGAIRGSKFDKIVETCEQMPQDIVAAFTSCGFVKTPKKRKDITILRCTASIPHWCSYWMRRADVGKKINSSPCHAALQFPGAASLPMSRQIRLEHLRFCDDFSKLLPGGVFNVNIYMTACSNQIPLGDIPVEVLELLGISSSSESYTPSEIDLQPFDNSKSVVKR